MDRNTPNPMVWIPRFGQIIRQDICDQNEPSTSTDTGDEISEQFNRFYREQGVVFAPDIPGS